MCIRDRVIVPGNADGLAGAAYGFHQQVHNLVQRFPVNALDVLAKAKINADRDNRERWEREGRIAPKKKHDMEL